MDSVEEKFKFLEPFFVEAVNSPPRKDNLSERQQFTARIASQDILKMEAQRREHKFNQQIQKEREQIKTLKVENNIRAWLPTVVCGCAGCVLIAYFFILVQSGRVNNGFELDTAVLSSIGVSAVGGSLALVGFIVQGLFRAKATSSVSKRPKSAA